MVGEMQQMDRGVADSIAMLEQILEVMPQDLEALMALYNVYSQCGQRERAFKYLKMSVGVACDQNDAEKASHIQEQLNLYESMFPEETEALLAKLETVSAKEPLVAVAPVSSASSSSEIDISEELALAWRLFEEEQLSQEEYSSVVHDLTEISSKELNVPASVLHVLVDRGYSQINRIMNYMSTRSSVPYLSLSDFELSEKVADIMPVLISSKDGALPFGFFGEDLLVGVLNPFNNSLVEKVEKVSGRRCHTYLVSSEEYDSALGRLITARG